MKAKRKRSKDPVVADLLIKTRRRCCLCVYLDGNVNRRRVQIAHIDGNRSNSIGENLVPLCLDHHDEFDSRTSQSKGLTQHEIRAYRERLMSEIADGTLEIGPPEASYETRKPNATLFASPVGYRYGALFAEVSRVLLAHDPVNIAEGHNPDEYDPEAHDILSRLQSGETENVAAMCHDVFTRWFSEGIARSFDKYEEMASDILEAWGHYEAMTTTYLPEEKG